MPRHQSCPFSSIRTKPAPSRLASPRKFILILQLTTHSQAILSVIPKFLFHVRILKPPPPYSKSIYTYTDPASDDAAANLASQALQSSHGTDPREPSREQPQRPSR